MCVGAHAFRAELALSTAACELSKGRAAWSQNRHAVPVRAVQGGFGALGQGDARSRAPRKVHYVAHQRSFRLVLSLSASLSGCGLTRICRGARWGAVRWFSVCCLFTVALRSSACHEGHLGGFRKGCEMLRTGSFARRRVWASEGITTPCSCDCLVVSRWRQSTAYWGARGGRGCTGCTVFALRR